MLIMLFTVIVGAKESKMQVQIEIGNDKYNAFFENSGIAQAVAALFPKSVKMEEYAANNEYYARLDSKISSKASEVDKIFAGDIMLYNSISLVIFYADAEHTSGYVKLGHIENPTGLKKSLGAAGGKLRFSLANGAAKTDEVTELQNLYREMWKILIAKDASGIKHTHAENFVLMHMTGSRMNRAEFIAAVQDGTLNYYTADHDEINVKIDGNHATLVGKSRVNAAVYGGGRHTWRLQQNMTLEKINGVWLFTHSKASTY
ncbi:hypothetical protein B7994_04730 [Fibrobacter sp. UWR2]|nr:hypothetical protein B7994_04730 [Fibrobacter sp. UWR2]